MELSLFKSALCASLHLRHCLGVVQSMLVLPETRCSTKTLTLGIHPLSRTGGNRAILSVIHKDRSETTIDLVTHSVHRHIEGHPSHTIKGLYTRRLIQLVSSP